MSEVAVVAGTQ